MLYGAQLANEQKYFTLGANLNKGLPSEVVYSLTGNIRANEELWNTNHNSKSRAVKKTTILADLYNKNIFIITHIPVLSIILLSNPQSCWLVPFSLHSF